MRLMLSALTLLLLAGCAAPPAWEEHFEPQIIHFDSNEVGAVPRDFSTALTGKGGPPAWAVREDSIPSDGHRVLMQESEVVTNYRFPLCVYEKITARDVAVETYFKPISGTLDEAGGVVLRYTPENYYIARANALENNVILFKTVKGKRSKVKEVPVPVSKGVWHKLRFEARGHHLTIMLDGKIVLERNDRTFSNPGKVGLWTKADSVTAFAGLKIERVAP